MEDKEYDEIRPYSEGRAVVHKGSLWGYVDENGYLVSKTVVGQESQGYLIVMQNHSAMGGQKFMMLEHKTTMTI